MVERGYCRIVAHCGELSNTIETTLRTLPETVHMSIGASSGQDGVATQAMILESTTCEYLHGRDTVASQKMPVPRILPPPF